MNRPNAVNTPIYAHVVREATCIIECIEGRDLVIKDRNNSSDPYYIIKLVKTDRSNPRGRGEEILDEYKSEPIKQTLNPKWKPYRWVPKAFKYSFFAEFRYDVRFEVWDEDKLSGDDFMGQATLTLDEEVKDGATFSSWISLYPPFGEKGSIPGELNVRITFKSNEEIDEVPAP